MVSEPEYQPDIDTLYLSCDVCDGIFDAYDETQGDCQIGHDGRHGAVQSLCPKCYAQARDDRE